MALIVGVIAYAVGAAGLVWGMCVLGKRADKDSARILAKEMPEFWEIR
jgi:hypothetical protein